MALVPPSASQLLLVVAFVAVSSAAGLQWAGMAAQGEAARQQASRQTLSDFAAQLSRLESASLPEKAKLAATLADMAERFARETNRETLASGSRRVVALASYEGEPQVRDRELQERLRAEVRGLVIETESLESAALSRANWFGSITQTLIAAAALLLCGILSIRWREHRLPGPPPNAIGSLR